MELLTCKNLYKNYGKKQVLKNINLEIPKGKIIGLLGKNGSGKTTLIKIINDLLVPTSGEVLVNGQKVGVESKKIISYLPEKSFLDHGLKVKEIISYYGDFYEDFQPNKAYELLEKLHLNPNEKLRTMSKGMKEKVQLVLVMSRKADLYVLDEPIGGVDPATRDYIMDTILTNFNDGASILISTHLIADVERILDEVIFMDEGTIHLTASADDLRNQYGKSINEIFREVFKC